MPLYEYECTVCGHRTELIQRLSDPPLSACPKCGEPVRKLLSAPSFQFKGSGWYVTDYAGNGSKGAQKDEKGSEATKDSSGSDSAPAADKKATESKKSESSDSSS